MNLSDLRQLTTLQFDECRERAIKRVQRHLGERPTRARFEKELGRLWTILDVLALIVFLAALFISSIHIVTHMGALSARDYDTLNQATSGTVTTRDFYVASHQWAYIPLAEAAMILFLVMFGTFRDGWRRWVFLSLALLSVAFVLVANFSSGLGILESSLAPAFTIGIGLKLEHLIIQHMKRRREVTERYLEALAIWEAATNDATEHPNYRPYLMNELWAALMKPKTNQWAIEAQPGFKRAAVERELSRENWTEGAAEPVAMIEAPASEEVELERVAVPFGNTAPEPGGPESMLMMPSVNGHGIAVTSQQ